MKDDIHPKYQEVLFVDTANGKKRIIGSTLKPEGTEMFEGKSYPVYKVAISSASHPFFTGDKKLVDAEGRVERFAKKYGSRTK